MSALTVRDRDTTTAQAVLSAAMLEPERLPDLRLTAADFAERDDSRIFQAMLTLLEKGHSIEPVAIAHEAGADLLDYANDLSGMIGSAANISYHADRVRDAARQRKLAALGEQLTAGATAGNAKTAELIEITLSGLTAVEDSTEAAGPVPAIEALRDAVKAAGEQKAGGGLAGLSTGLRALDHKLGGLLEAALIIIAARPSQGKTSLAGGNLALAALHSGARVVVFSLESSAREIMQRLLAAEARLNLSRITRGPMSAEGWVGLTEAQGRLEELFADNLFVDVESDTVAAMQTTLRRAALSGPVGLVVIDYLQLVRAGGRRGENRNLDLAEITRSLKRLAKQYNCPVVCLSQLSRAVESRGGKPRLADLRDSGAIEQDADVVLLLHEDQQDGHEIIVGKNRNGPCGSVPVIFQKEIVRFDDRPGG